jgi:hypothetical protein
MVRWPLLAEGALAIGLVASPAVQPDAASVERTEIAVQASVKAGDVKMLERLVRPDFVMFHAGGDWEDRTGWLSKVRERRLSRLTSEATEYDVAIRLLSGDVAVRSWIVRFRDRGRAEDTWIRGTRTFVHDGVQWRLAAQQSSLLQDGPIAPPQDLTPYVGRYRTMRGSELTITSRGDYLLSVFRSGEHNAVTPRGGDVFGMGAGMTLTFERGNDGRVTAAVKRFGEQLLWRAQRVVD